VPKERVAKPGGGPELTPPPEGSARATRSALVQTVSVALTGSAGMVFWLVAARRCPPEVVGADAMLLAVVQATAAASDLNLNSSLPRLLPQLGSRRTAFVALSYGLCALAGACFGAAFLGAIWLFPQILPTFHVGPGQAGILIGSVIVLGWFALQDTLLIAVRKPYWVLLENSGFAAGKILLLWFAVTAGLGHPIFVSWLVPAALLIVPVVFWPVRTGLRDFEGGAPLTVRGRNPTRTVLISFLAFDYGALLVHQIVYLVLPLVVTARLGPALNAAFVICFTSVIFSENILVGMGNAVMVEAAAAPHQAVPLIQRTVSQLARVLLPALAVGIVVAPLVLKLFGQHYVRVAVLPMRLMLLAVVPQVVVAVRTLLWRLDGNTGNILGMKLGALAMLSALLILLLPAGLAGVGAAWLLTQLLIAAAALPSIAHRLRQGRQG
jgi:O-antigen/teichoic acid export membrane protein